MTSKLETIRASFRTEVAALVAKYPAQAPNAAHHEHQASTMRLGVTVRTIRTKLHTFPAGVLVGMIDDSFGGEARVSIWAPGISSGPTFTCVRPDRVMDVCTSCDGAGHVFPHPTALVAVNCPSC